MGTRTCSYYFEGHTNICHRWYMGADTPWLIHVVPEVNCLEIWTAFPTTRQFPAIHWQMTTILQHAAVNTRQHSVSCNYDITLWACNYVSGVWSRVCEKYEQRLCPHSHIDFSSVALIYNKLTFRSSHWQLLQSRPGPTDILFNLFILSSPCTHKLDYMWYVT